MRVVGVLASNTSTPAMVRGITEYHGINTKKCLSFSYGI